MYDVQLLETTDAFAGARVAPMLTPSTATIATANTRVTNTDRCPPREERVIRKPFVLQAQRKAVPNSGRAEAKKAGHPRGTNRREVERVNTHTSAL